MAPSLPPFFLSYPLGFVGEGGGVHAEGGAFVRGNRGSFCRMWKEELLWEAGDAIGRWKQKAEGGVGVRRQKVEWR